MPRSAAKQLKEIYGRLYKYFGPQSWWPGDTRLEIIVGAVLTQNTNWKNVEKAIANLKTAHVLSLSALHKLTASKLSQLIKPSGYFNIKAKRLKSLIQFIVHEYGSLQKMAQEETGSLRSKLLDVYGVGEETADSILLYAFDRPVFVIDTYTKRILSRYGLVKPEISYPQLQAFFTDHSPVKSAYFNEYHALLVCLGKDYCRPKPKCSQCPLKRDCRKKTLR